MAVAIDDALSGSDIVVGPNAIAAGRLPGRPGGVHGDTDRHGHRGVVSQGEKRLLSRFYQSPRCWIPVRMPSSK